MELRARGITMHWIGYTHNHAAGMYGIQSRYRIRVMMSQDVVFLEPKETRKQEKELAIIQEKSLRPARKKNEVIYVSDEDGNKNMQESDSEEENGDIPYLIPQEEQNTSNTDESETNEEEQDRSCAF